MDHQKETRQEGVLDYARLKSKAAKVLADALLEPLEVGLYLTATPIGHLQDISLRALSVLARADVIAAEDTRHSKKLLSYYGIKAELLSYHDHNGEIMGPKLTRMIENGESVALISDAGTPLISDPGYKLALMVRDAGLKVHVVPGPSSVTAALCLSGLPTDRFFFQGFLPAKAGARGTRLKELAKIDASLIFFESTKRVAKVLSEMSDVFGERDASVLRELTKLHEEVISAPLPELHALLSERSLKGEIVLIISPPRTCSISDDELETELSEKLSKGLSVRDSVSAVMQLHDLPKRRVYELALKVKGDAGDE